MKKKRILGILLAGAMLMGVFTACRPAGPPPAAEQNVTSQPAATPDTPAQAGTTPAAPEGETGFQRGIRVAGMSEPSSIAPGQHSVLNGHFMNTMVNNALFRVHEEGLAPVNDVITGWTALSDTVFEFYIREGILFHNGDELTAYDVSASWYYVRNYPNQRTVHVGIESWEVIDRYTIRLDTGTPHAVLFNDLAHQGNMLMPASLIEAGHDFHANPVGSGPFRFEEWRPGEFISFTVFENYFDQERFPRLGYVHWRFVPEGSSRTIALETGELDFLVDVATPDVPRLEANPDINVMQRPGATFSYFMLNNDRHPFNNIHVRHAIDMALDRDAMILASLDGFGIPIRTSMPTMFPGASEEGTRNFDPEGARALLAEHNLDPETLGFEVLAFDEVQRRRAEVVQANLADIGIPITISMIDHAAWGDVTVAGDFDASFANLTANALPVFMRNMFTIEMIGVRNSSRVYNHELDEIIMQAVVTMDESARVALLEEASRIANEHAGLLGTNMNIVIRAFNSNLVVPELAANGFMFKNMMYWAE